MNAKRYGSIIYKYVASSLDGLSDFFNVTFCLLVLNISLYLTKAKQKLPGYENRNSVLL